MLIPGELAVDDRGTLAFVNGADLTPYVRFYVVRNHSAPFVRAWHGHRHEEKLVTVLYGAALVCCVQIDDWASPSPELEVKRYVLAADKPAALHIPGGYANGAMTLLPNTALCYFSNVSIECAGRDDYRWPARLWDPWHVDER